MWLSSFMTTTELTDYGWRLPFLVAAALSFLPLLFWRFIGETPFFSGTYKIKCRQKLRQAAYHTL
ncbi:L-proline/glycine betaine transporter ProP [Psychrobacter sp. JCM 18901]|nr:L-proline/glycine betaine transporter ProP [Psychrobacter sp. JCM 18901]